jgi:para-nitrobenzyl esterase
VCSAFQNAAGASSLAELRKLPAEKILAATRGMAWPNVDGYAIPSDQVSLYDAGKFNDTPVLIGYNSDEGLSFSRVTDPKNYVDATRQRYAGFADKLLEAYPAGDTGHPKSARDLARDTVFGWHTWTWARKQSSLGKSKAFLYYFDQHKTDGDRGAAHGEDLPYVFGHLTAFGNMNPTDADLLDEFCQIRRSERRGIAEMAGVHRSQPADDGPDGSPASRTGS